MTTTPTTPELTADLPRVLLVANPKCCALYVDGQRVPLVGSSQPDAIDLTPAVRALANLADVVVIEEGIDRRCLTMVNEDGDTIWRPTLASVVERRAELAQAQRLRAEAQAALEQAAQIETQP